jgi:hypothetical protein
MFLALIGAAAALLLSPLHDRQIDRLRRDGGGG